MVAPPLTLRYTFLMATKKSTTTTKSRATKVKKPAAAKTTKSRKAAPRKKQLRVESFKLSRNDRPFLSFNPTIQTVYWIILGIVVIAFTAWIMKLQSDISMIYDQIDANESIVIDEPALKKKQQ